MGVTEEPERPSAAFAKGGDTCRQQPTTTADLDDTSARIATEAEAIAAIAKECIGTNAPLATWRGRVLAVIGVIGTRLPILHSGRRPKFFADTAVRERLVELHREVTIDAAVADCRARFGSARTPSTSAVQRFWSYLDKLQEPAKRR